MKQIYADYNATYPCSEEHMTEVSSLLKAAQGNPSSIHKEGRQAKKALENSRAQIAKLFSCERQHIHFTSGATEANNLVIFGLTEKLRASHAPIHIISSSGEHSSVSKPIKHLVNNSLCTSSTIALNKNGCVKQEELIQSINKDTKLVCLIFGNNETGAINPIIEICKKIKEVNPEIHFHVDGVQAFGKLDTSWVHNSPIDSFSATAHKIGGYKGIGCLYLKPHISLSPTIFGGGQEQGLRSGTENIPGIISFGLIAKEISENPSWCSEVKAIHEHIINSILSINGLHLHGDLNHCMSNTINFHIDQIEGQHMMLQFELAGISVSNGSACSSGVSSASNTLLGMGYSKWVASNSIRVSLGSRSTIKEANEIIKVIKQCSQH